MRSENPHTRLSRLAVLAVAALCAGCEEPPPDLTHGYIKVQFARSEAAADSPYVGTAEVTITATYDSCFSGFYDTNPNWKADGVDGALVFGTREDGGEGWRDRLCADPESQQARCSVIDIEQQLDVAKLLTVTYEVPENPENRFLKFGPLPLIDQIPEFECEGGSPRMQISPQQISGQNAAGETIWEGEALDEDMAAPGQGKAVVVKSARSD